MRDGPLLYLEHMIPNRLLVDETLPPRVGCLNHDPQHGFDIGDRVANVRWALESQPKVLVH